MNDVEQTVMIERMCSHCLHEWSQRVNSEELKKLAHGEAISDCPNPKCGLLT